MLMRTEPFPDYGKEWFKVLDKERQDIFLALHSNDAELTDLWSSGKDMYACIQPLMPAAHSITTMHGVPVPGAHEYYASLPAPMHAVCRAHPHAMPAPCFHAWLTLPRLDNIGLGDEAAIAIGQYLLRNTHLKKLR